MSSNAHENPATSPSGDSATPSFAELGVPQALCELLIEQGITAPFPIQAATLIDSMSGRDVLGRGRTGSGKTLAFALPVLARLAASATQRQPKAPRALILAPTRELALQIEATFAPLAKALNLKTMCIFGGVNQGPQVTRLRDGVFMQRAQVTVNVQQFRSQQVSVLGSVGRPGRYPLEQRGVRLTEMLATAGGILPTGSDTLILIRREGGKSTRTVVDLPSLYLNDRPDLDIEVKGGDSIYVHRASVIYVFGQVQRPGQFTLERDMNVRQALAKAGGFTMRAREQKVLVQRIGRDGKAVESELGLDDTVLADDQIYVRESLF
jgi:polysaccharide export protein EpsE